MMNLFQNMEEIVWINSDFGRFHISCNELKQDIRYVVIIDIR